METVPAALSASPPKEGEYSKAQLDAIKAEHQSKYETVSDWAGLEDLDIVDVKTDPHGNGTYKIHKWTALFTSKSPKDRILAKKELCQVIEKAGAQSWMADKVIASFISQDAKGKLKASEDKANAETIRIFSNLVEKCEDEISADKSKVLAKMFANALTSAGAGDALKKMVKKKIVRFADLLTMKMLEKHTRKAKANAFKSLVCVCLDNEGVEMDENAELQLSKLCVTLIKDKIGDVKKAGHEGLARIGAKFGEDRLEKLWKSSTQKESDSFQKNWKYVTTEMAKLINKGGSLPKEQAGPPEFKWADVQKEVVKDQNKTVIALLITDDQADNKNRDLSEEFKDSLVSAFAYISDKLSKTAIKKFERCENLMQTIEKFLEWAAQPQKLLKDASRRRDVKDSMHGPIVSTFGKSPKTAVNACANLASTLIDKLRENNALKDKTNEFGAAIAVHLVQLTPTRHEPEAQCHHSIVLISKLCKMKIIPIDSVKKVFDDAGDRDFGALVFTKEYLKDESAIADLDDKFIKLMSRTITNQMLAKKHKANVAKEIMVVLSGLASSRSKGNVVQKAISDCDKSNTLTDKLNTKTFVIQDDSKNKPTKVTKASVSIAKDVENTMQKLVDLSKMDNVSTGISGLTNCISKKVRNEHKARATSSKKNAPLVRADFDEEIFGQLARVLRAPVKNQIVHKNCLICFGALVGVMGKKAERTIEKNIVEIVKFLDPNGEDVIRKQSIKCLKECTESIGIGKVLPCLANMPTNRPKKNEERVKSDLFHLIQDMVELWERDVADGMDENRPLIDLVPKIIFCMDNRKMNQNVLGMGRSVLKKICERTDALKVSNEIRLTEAKLKTPEMKRWLQETDSILVGRTGTSMTKSGFDTISTERFKKKSPSMERNAAVNPPTEIKSARKHKVAFVLDDRKEAKKTAPTRKSIRMKIMEANSSKNSIRKSEPFIDESEQDFGCANRQVAKSRNRRKSRAGQAQKSNRSEGRRSKASGKAEHIPLLIAAGSKEERGERYMTTQKKGHKNKNVGAPREPYPVFQIEKYEDFMQELLTCVSPPLFEKLTAPSNRSQRHIEAMDLVKKFMVDYPDTTVAVSDVLLRWAACKIDDSRTPPSTTLVISEFISSICELLMSSGAVLTEYEASALILPVARKCGSTRESVQKAVYTCLLSISDVLSESAMLSMLCSCFKNNIEGTACEQIAPIICKLIGKMFNRHEAIPSSILLSLAEAAHESDEAVGRAAAFCLLSVTSVKGEECLIEIKDMIGVNLMSIVEDRMEQASAYVRETEMTMRTPSVRNPFGVAPKLSITPFSASITPKSMSTPIARESTAKTLKDIRMSDFRLSVAPEPSGKVITSIKEILGTHTPARTRHHFGHSRTPKLTDSSRVPFELQVPEYVDFVKYFLENLSSKIRKKQEKAVSILYEDIKKKDKSKLRKKPSDVIPALLRSFGDVLRRLLGKNAEKEDSLLLKRFLNSVMAFGSDPQIMSRLNLISLHISMEELMSALVPNEVAEIGDWKQIKRGAKVIIVRMIDACDYNMMFSSLIKVLTKCLQDPVDASSLEDRSRRALKCDYCLKTIARIVKRGFNTCNIDELLRDMHTFLSVHPVKPKPEFLTDEQKVIIQLLKTVVNNIIENLGTKIRNYVGLLPNDEQNSQLMLYIESKLLQGRNGELGNSHATSSMSVPSPVSVPSPLSEPVEGSKPFELLVPPLVFPSVQQSSNSTVSENKSTTPTLPGPQSENNPQKSPRERLGLPPRENAKGTTNVALKSDSEQMLGMSSSGQSYLQRLMQIQKRYKSGDSSGSVSLPLPVLTSKSKLGLSPSSQVFSSVNKRIEAPISPPLKVQQVLGNTAKGESGSLQQKPIERLQQLREKMSRLAEKRTIGSLDET